MTVRTMAKRIALIINPVSGGARGADLHRFEGIATEHGWSLDVLGTEHTGHATELARRASDEGFDLVVAAGGDGTINEAVNGLAMRQTPLGIVPLGTANVLAREVGIPLEPEDAFRRAISFEPEDIALGHLESGGLSRYFCLMAGVGFDASVVHNVNTALKKRIGKWAYVLKALQTFVLWQSPSMNVTVDGQPNLCQSAIICNARKYAGDFVMAPQADIRQPGFTVVLIKGMDRKTILGFALALVGGRHLGLRNVEAINGQEIMIDSEAFMQVDGDSFGRAPATITALPAALRLVC